MANLGSNERPRRHVARFGGGHCKVDGSEKRPGRKLPIRWWQDEAVVAMLGGGE